MHELRYVLSGLLFFVVSCGPPVKGGLQYDEASDFSRYQSFAWTGGTRVVFSGEVSATLQQRIALALQESVRRELVQAGLVLLPRPDQSNLILQAIFTSVRRPDVPATMGYAEQDDAQYGLAQNIDVTQAILSLEMLDRETERLVWKNAVSVTIFGDLERAATDREIAIAVDRVLAGFPPP